VESPTPEKGSWWRRTPSLPSLTKRKLSFLHKLHSKKRSAPVFAANQLPPAAQPPEGEVEEKEEKKDEEIYLGLLPPGASCLLHLRRKVTEQEAEILRLEQHHDENLAEISIQLLRLQASLQNKERLLGQIIQEREQTIIEQQRVIRRLLRRGQQRKAPEEVDDGESSSSTRVPSAAISPAASYPDLVKDASGAPAIEISISVPDLSQPCRPPAVLRSISDIEERRRKTKIDRRAKNREKLLSMKRYSGFLKRPEILETVYSVEEKDGEEGEKVKEKENEEVEKEETLIENGIAAEEEEEKNSDEKVPRRESETTEYDCSTDDDSLRLIFSETDHSTCCSVTESELCSRRSSSGSQPNIAKKVARLGAGPPLLEEDDGKSRSMEDLRRQLKLVEKRRKFLECNTSISLDCADG